LPKKFEYQPPKNILIIKLSAIGDVVHSLPFLETLRSGFPGAHIDWVVEEDAFQIIEGHPGINRIMISRRKSWGREVLRETKGPWTVLKEISGFLKNLRAKKYDMVIDLQGLLKSGVLTGLSRGKRKIGMSGAREGGWLFFNEPPVPVDYDQHAVDRYLRVAEYVGCDAVSTRGSIPVPGSEKKKIDNILAASRIGDLPLVAINPMAKWKTKLWEPGRFAVLADKIRDEFHSNVIFTGSEHDREIIEHSIRLMKGDALNLAGKTSLKGLTYLYGRCKTLVCTDTGPMHMAVEMGCPVVALFGPTAPWRTGPYGRGHKVIRTDLDCSPCFKKKCSHMSCMKDISVERVLAGVREILKD
jgi:heptosyltransferase-1